MFYTLPTNNTVAVFSTANNQTIQFEASSAGHVSRSSYDQDYLESLEPNANAGADFYSAMENAVATSSDEDLLRNQLIYSLTEKSL